MTVTAAIFGPSTAIGGTYTLVADGVPAGTEVIALSVPVHSAAIATARGDGGNNSHVNFDFCIDQATFDDYEGVDTYTPTFVSWNLTAGHLEAVASFPGGTGGWLDPVYTEVGALWGWDQVVASGPAGAGIAGYTGIGTYTQTFTQGDTDWDTGDPTTGSWSAMASYNSPLLALYGGGSAPGVPPSIPDIPDCIAVRVDGGDFGFELVNWSLPAGPQIDAEGRIDPDQSTESAPEGRYFYTVTLNGTDYTFFRCQITKPLDCSSEDPGGDTDCKVSFPSVTALEELGTGDLADFQMYANLDVWLADVEADTQHRVFQGLVKRWAYEDNLLVAYCRGAGCQLNDYVRMQAITDEPADIGQLASGEFSHTSRVHLTGRLQEMAVVTTGITSRYRGDAGRSTDYLAKLYNLAWDPATGDKYTWMVGDGRTPETVLVVDPQTVTDPDFWIDFGAEGVDPQIEQDGGAILKVFYVGGQEPGGQPLDQLYPLDPDGVFHLPLEADMTVHDVVDDGTGTLVTDTATGPFDPDGYRVETYWDFGAGVGRDEAAGILHQIRLMLKNGHNWAGTLTLNGIDPKNNAGTIVPKALMRPNMTVGLRWICGTGSEGMIFRIAQRNLNPVENSIELVIDTKRRDIHWLEAIANREDVKAKNPIARLNIGTDATKPVSKAVWDTKRSGWIPNDDTNGHRWVVGDTSTLTLTGNTWNVYKFLAAEAENFYRFEFHLTENAAFHVSLYNMDPTDVSHTIGLPADPFETPSGTPVTGPWTPPLPNGFINGWGQTLLDSNGVSFRQAAGFYPLKDANDDGTDTGATPTGDFVVQGDFTFDHDEASSAEEAATGINEPAYLWVAIWIPTAGTFHGWGRMIRGQRKG